MALLRIAGFGFHVLLFLVAVAAAATEPVPISRVAEIRQLGRAEASQALPVRIRGVVTVQAASGFFVDDGERGIWVDKNTAENRGTWRGGALAKTATEAGALVEIEGVTDPGGYAPQIVAQRIRRVGTAALPVARRLTMDVLLSGSQDSQWLEMDGVIQDVVRSDYSPETFLTLAVGGQFCRVAVQQGETIEAEKFVDARVRVRGVFAAQVNLRSELAGLMMFVSDAADIEIIESPPADPFLSRRVALNRMLPFSPNESPGHRKVTRGVVTFAFPGKFFFIQEGPAGVRVDSKSAEVQAGDQVEVAGFVTTERTLAALRGGVVRPLGRAALPPPTEVSAAQILHPRLRSEWTGEAFEDFSGRLIRLRGRLLRIERGENGEPLKLLLDADGNVFQAWLPQIGQSPLPDDWVVGSELELTGTAELDFNEQPGSRSAITVSGFRVWLSSPANARVLTTPPWWTPQRLWLALGGTALVLLIALAWVEWLRREVNRRGARIAAEISARREAKLEYQTTLRERSRLATDLHDTLEQALTGVSLQLQAAELFRDDDSTRSTTHLQLAQKFLDRSREELHRTVWDLRPDGLDGRGIVETLRDRVGRMVAGSPIRFTVESAGENQDIPDFIAGNLLLLAQEAVTNALKHAASTQIDVHFDFRADGVTLRVTDDGGGFDPAQAPGHRDGHFGLQGMRERAKRVGGVVHITSAVGSGTQITVDVPAKNFGKL